MKAPGTRVWLAQCLCGPNRHCIAALAAGSVDAILHDPPRFGIAGELYAQSFYDELARVLAAYAEKDTADA